MNEQIFQKPDQSNIDINDTKSPSTKFIINQDQGA